MAENIERAFEWDDEIEHDGGSFLLLDDGDYTFSVTKFERGHHGGSEKIPPCNKAILSIAIETPEGTATINCNLFLHSKFEWKLCQFFTSIGQRQHGEKLKMDWSKVIGAIGRCKIGTRTWKKDDGSEGKSNEVLEFYEPADTTPAFKPGEF